MTIAAAAMKMRYRTIVADPPWAYPEGFASDKDAPHRRDRERGARSDGFVRTALPYDAMGVDAIEAIPVSDLADSDARLFLWATSRYLPAALRVLGRWGFDYRQTIVWDKRPNVNPLAGGVAAIAAEFLLVGARGNPGLLSRWPSSVITARKPRAVHSVKPEVFLDVVEAVSPGPYIELFARRARFGWDYWGDESLGTAELVA
jgi:N6-adenosine-specific RNA methylase IME4